MKRPFLKSPPPEDEVVSRPALVKKYIQFSQAFIDQLEERRKEGNFTTFAEYVRAVLRRDVSSDQPFS